MAVVLEESVTGSTASATSVALTSWTPASNELIAVFVMLQKKTGTTISASGNGITFDEIIEVDSASGSCGVHVLRGMDASPSSGQITVTLTGNDNAAWCIAARFSGVDTSGTNGSGAIDATASNTGGNNTNAKIDITTLTDNAKAVGALAVHSGTATFTPPGDEDAIDLNNVAGGSFPDVTTGSLWSDDIASAGATTLGADGSLSPGRVWCAAAIAVKPAAAAGDPEGPLLGGKLVGGGILAGRLVR